MGEYVTSGSENKISLKFKKCAILNKSIQNGQPGRYRKTQRNTKERKKDPPTQPEFEKNTQNREECQRVTKRCAVLSISRYVSEDPRIAYDTPVDYP